MARAAPVLVLVAILVPALAGEREAPLPDPVVERLLGDGAGTPLAVTVNVSADRFEGGTWRGGSSRSVRGPATAPFRADLPLGAEPGAPEVRAEVRLEDGLVVYDLTCLAPIPAREDGDPPDRLRSVARGACSTFGQLAVLPLPGAGGEVRIAAWLSVWDQRDRDLFPPDRPDRGGATDRTFALVLRELPAGAGLPDDPESPPATADAFLRDTGSRELRRLSLRLAPGAAGSLESLVERSYLADFDVEVCQSPTVPIFDPVPGDVPAGLAVRIGSGPRDPAIEWSYTALLAMEQFETTLGGVAPPLRIETPAIGGTAGRLTLQSGAALLPVATLAGGGTLILDARAAAVE